MKLSKYEAFLENAKRDQKSFNSHVEKMKGSGSFEFKELAEKLFELQNKLNNALIVYLFSNDKNDRLIEHIVNKYLEKHRNILLFLFALDNEMRFFILHELKTNQNLFSNC